jgi:hypothetical protein
MHNALTDKHIKSWKGKKEVLVAKIKKLQPPPPPPPPTAKSKSVETIGGFTCDLLSKVVDHVDDNGNKVSKDAKDAQPVGMSYQSILAAVKKQFPACKTNYNCLRCYAGRLRESGGFVPVHRLPSRWK